MGRNPWEELLDVQLDTTTVCAVLIGGLLAMGFVALCVYAACTAVCQPKYLRRRQEERRNRVKKYRRRNRVASGSSMPDPPGADPTPHGRSDRFACAADDPPALGDDTDRRTAERKRAENVSQADVNTVGMSSRGRSKAAKKSKKQKEGANESLDKRRQRSKSVGDGTIRARGDKGRQSSLSEGTQVVREGAERHNSIISGSTSTSVGGRARQRSLSGGSSQSSASNAQGRNRSVSIERQKSLPGGTPQSSPLGRERLRSSSAGGSMARLRYARRLSLNAEKAKREMKMKRKKPPKRRTTRNLEAKVEVLNEKEEGVIPDGTQGGAHREGAPKATNRELPSGGKRKESDWSPVKSRDDVTTEETDLERSSSSLTGLQDSRGAVGRAITAEMAEYTSPVKRKGQRMKCESSV